MKTPHKKVPYRKEGKRNPMKDISTPAGRIAKHRASQKGAVSELRAVLNNPTDTKGKPVAGHIVTKIAAERLNALGPSSSTSLFEFATQAFLSTLQYSWGCAPTLSVFWKTFIALVKEEDANLASEFLSSFEHAFRWCVAGHVQRLNVEYEQRPDAIIMVEIWKNRAGYYTMGVQRDGNRRLMPPDSPPEMPTIIWAGEKTHAFVAPRDLKRIWKLGFKRFSAMCEAGKFKFSPPPLELVLEDTMLNVAAPSPAELATIRQKLRLVFATRHYRPKRKPNSNS